MRLERTLVRGEESGKWSDTLKGDWGVIPENDESMNAGIRSRTYLRSPRRLGMDVGRSVS